MIGRKLVLIRNRDIYVAAEVLSQQIAPDVNKVKPFVVNVSKNLIKIAVFIILKIYVKMVNFLKVKYSEFRIKIAAMGRGNEGQTGFLRTETNKFLKTIAEYKNRVSRMKESIHREEEKNS